MSWVAINMPHHMLLGNPAKELAEHLNNIGATYFILLSDKSEDVSGVAWVQNEVS